MKEELPQDVVDEREFDLKAVERGSVLFKLVLDKFKRDEEQRFARQVELAIAPQVKKYLEKKLAAWQVAAARDEMKATMYDVEKELQAEAHHYEAVMAEVQRQLGLSGEGATARELVEQWLAQGSDAPGAEAGLDQMSVSVPLLGDFSFLLAGLAAEIALHVSTATVPVIGTALTAFRLVYREMSVRKEIRKKLADKLGENMDHIVSKNSALIKEKVRESFAGLSERIGANIDQQIAVVDASLTEIIDRKRGREYSARQEAERLGAATGRIDESVRAIERLVRG